MQNTTERDKRRHNCVSRNKLSRIILWSGLSFYREKETANSVCKLKLEQMEVLCHPDGLMSEVTSPNITSYFIS
jgi:hypothetical protein